MVVISFDAFVKTLIAAGVLCTLAACASGPRNPSTWQGARTHFMDMDKNDDGVLMQDEINPELALYQEFARYDVDGTSAIEEDEFYDYINDREGR